MGGIRIVGFSFSGRLLYHGGTTLSRFYIKQAYLRELKDVKSNTLDSEFRDDALMNGG
jgi:hypothetical protein